MRRHAAQRHVIAFHTPRSARVFTEVAQAAQRRVCAAQRRAFPSHAPGPRVAGGGASPKWGLARSRLRGFVVWLRAHGSFPGFVRETPRRGRLKRKARGRGLWALYKVISWPGFVLSPTFWRKPSPMSGFVHLINWEKRGLNIMHEAGFVHLGNGWAPAWPVAWRASAVVLGREWC